MSWQVTDRVSRAPRFPLLFSADFFSLAGGASLENAFVPLGRCEVLSNHQLDDRLSVVGRY